MMLITLLTLAAWAQDEASSGADEVVDDTFQPVEPLRNNIAVSTKVTQPAITTPASVSVITKDQIARAGYRSVAEALGTVPGFYVTYDLINYHVAVRGALGGARSGSRLLKVMIDGVPVPFAQSETYFLGPEFLPMSSIERIEVFRGPASSLYGAGAYAGAINVVTRQEPYEGETTVGGEVRGYYGAMAVTGPGGDGAISVTSRGFNILVGGAGALEDRSGLTVPDSSPFAVDYAGQESTDDRATPAVAFVKSVASIGGGRLAMFGITQIHQRDAEFYDVSVLSGDTRNALLNWKASAAYDRAFGKAWTATARAAVSGGQTTDSDRLQLPGEPFYYERELSTFNTSGALELRYDFPNLAFWLVGADAYTDSETLPQYTEVAQGAAPVARNEQVSQNLNNVAVYTQAVAPLTPGLGIAVGGRLDQHSVFDTQLNGRAAVNLDHRDQVAFKLIGGTSFKAASPEQLYMNAPGAIPFEIEGEETLQPQRLVGVEAVLEGYPTKTVLLNASGFTNQYQDTIGYLRQEGELVPTSYNASNLGGEAGVRLHQPILDQSFLDAEVSLSLQQTITEDNPDAVFEEKAFPDNEAVPTTMAYTRLGVVLDPAKSSLAVEYRYVGDRVPTQSNLLENNVFLISQPNYTLGDYHMLDATLSSMPIEVSPGMSVRGLVKVANVLDQQFLEVGFNGVDVPGLGRTLWLRADVML